MLGLALSGVVMRYSDLAAPALDLPRLEIAPGGSLAVTGPSGAGKSTFIHVITGLERPTAGRVEWRDEDIAQLPEAARDAWRARNVGLVMQDFHLFPGLSALDNVALPARLARAFQPSMAQRARDLLARLGLQKPAQMIETMSRGEMQRVAIARALLRNPGLIVADEPTASLDPRNADLIGTLLLELAAQAGATLVVVSHDARLTARLGRQVRLHQGRIAADGLARAA